MIVKGIETGEKKGKWEAEKLHRPKQKRKEPDYNTLYYYDSTVMFTRDELSHNRVINRYPTLIGDFHGLPELFRLR